MCMHMDTCTCNHSPYSLLRKFLFAVDRDLQAATSNQRAELRHSVLPASSLSLKVYTFLALQVVCA